ncbi:hypothetical protein V8C86DRAFT_461244 [Haematococcus lacustris]
MMMGYEPRGHWIGSSLSLLLAIVGDMAKLAPLYTPMQAEATHADATSKQPQVAAGAGAAPGSNRYQVLLQPDSSMEQQPPMQPCQRLINISSPSIVRGRDWTHPASKGDVCDPWLGILVRLPGLAMRDAWFMMMIVMMTMWGWVR